MTMREAIEWLMLKKEEIDMKLEAMENAGTR